MAERKHVNVKIENEVFSVEIGTKVEDIIYEKYVKNREVKVLGVKVFNKIESLNYEVEKDCELKLLDLTKSNGIRIYKRSISLVFIKAVGDIFPNSHVNIMHSINKGIYCEIEMDKILDDENIKTIDEQMKKIIKEDLKIENINLPRTDAIELFKKLGKEDKVKLLENETNDLISLHKCSWLHELNLEPVVPSTGYLYMYELVKYGKGLVIRFPNKENPLKLPKHEDQTKLGTVFEEHKKWLKILGVSNVTDLNDLIKSKSGIENFIRVSEALQEKKIAQIADKIAENRGKVFIVLIAGPSSSGKTTFAHRLSVQLRVNGFRPVAISLDDYFLDREHTPKDENGNYDFERIDALDLELFNKNLQDLLNGKEVEIPIFNFHKGYREPVGRKIRLESDEILVVEGIHGLNEELTRSIKRENKFKIYVSALAALNIDDHTRIPTTDLRLLRRIVRDNKYRSSNALNTMKLWPSVRRGEERFIFPYQEQADIMFNSALTYEPAVLKSFAEPLLKDITDEYEQYSEAQRLLKLLDLFLVLGSKDIPSNSIIREFIGGCCFY